MVHYPHTQIGALTILFQKGNIEISDIPKENYLLLHSTRTSSQTEREKVRYSDSRRRRWERWTGMYGSLRR